MIHHDGQLGLVRRLARGIERLQRRVHSVALGNHGVKCCQHILLMLL
jgi:hypothetical protein